MLALTTIPMKSLRVGISLFSCDLFSLWLGDYEKLQCLDLILRDSLHTDPYIENVTPVLGAITSSLLNLRQLKIVGPLDLVDCESSNGWSGSTFILFTHMAQAMIWRITKVLKGGRLCCLKMFSEILKNRPR